MVDGTCQTREQIAERVAKICGDLPVVFDKWCPPGEGWQLDDAVVMSPQPAAIITVHHLVGSKLPGRPPLWLRVVLGWRAFWRVVHG